MGKHVRYPDFLVPLDHSEKAFLLRALGLLSEDLCRTEANFMVSDDALAALGLEPLRVAQEQIQRLVEKLKAADCVLVLPSPRA